MGRKLWILAAIVVATGLLIGGGWLLSRPDREGSQAQPAPVRPDRTANADSGLRHPSGTEISALQRQANAACRCARRRGGDPRREDCWAEFNRSLAPFDHPGDASTACGEESVSLVCFGNGLGGEPCISTHRPYGGCSDEESARLEAEARARHQGGCSG